MKKLLFPLFITVAILASCSLTSQTFIGPQKAFELGDGKHGAFTAIVKNDCGVPVVIYKMPLGDTAIKLATLIPGQKKTIRFAANTKAIFKNNSNAEAVVKLKVTGDTGLSMGGPNY